MQDQRISAKPFRLWRASQQEMRGQRMRGRAAFWSPRGRLPRRKIFRSMLTAQQPHRHSHSKTNRRAQQKMSAPPKPSLMRQKLFLKRRPLRLQRVRKQWRTPCALTPTGSTL